MRGPAPSRGREPSATCARGDQLGAHLPARSRVALRCPTRRAASTNSWNCAARSDARRDRARQRTPLLRDLGGVVAGGEAVGADDRHDDHALDARPLARGLCRLRGRGGEEPRRLGLVGRGAGRRVDDGASAPSSASARPSPVMTSTPCEREIGDDLVAALLEHVDDVAAEPPGGSGDGDLVPESWLLSCFGAGLWSHRPLSWSMH